MVMALAACGTRESKVAAEPLRVLFVGNSLTYVGNLPAVFDALSAKNGLPTKSDMLVRGGATLTDWVRGGTVLAALEHNTYSVVVLQERGGDFACGFGPKVCEDSRASLAVLAANIRKHGARPVLLGTYQLSRDGSERIERAEKQAAAALGLDYVAVSEKLRKARECLPQSTWFASDGIHPGKDLTLLDALLVYGTLHARPPSGSDLDVEGPIYSYSAGPQAELREAATMPPQGDMPTYIAYAAADVVAVMGCTS